jgi:hypothetical protein
MGVKDEAPTQQLTLKNVASDQPLSVSAFDLPGGDDD